MKYIISEQQRDRILNVIKQFADTYKFGPVLRTEVEVEYDSKKELYILHPIFFVKEKKSLPYHIHKHLLAQKVEDYIGFPVHSASHRIESI